MHSLIFGFIFLIASWRTTIAAVPGYSDRQDTDQFHLQTDGDGDRYFIYQTNNGQYRKERRLKDGSVVGTTGWVDAAGYLRLQDYIADDQGYRIYKSKTVYVGVDRPIADSLQIAKSAPTDAGYGFTPSPPRAATPASRTYTTPRPSVSSTTITSPVFPLEVSITQPSPRYHSSTYSPTSTYTPSVDVSPNSIDLSSDVPRFDFRPTVAPITADEANGISSTYAPPSIRYEPPRTSSGDNNELEDESDQGSSPYRRLDYFNPNSYRHSGEWRRRYEAARYQAQSSRNPNLGDGYTPQFPEYDGVGLTTRAGFRYYLPKQYHEEEETSGTKTGSFGYVDPFGIRRVIYYNANPGTGFNIRKNNRYVGHDATPYDPRPL